MAFQYHSVGHFSVFQPSLKHHPYLKISVSQMPLKTLPPPKRSNSDGDTRGMLVLKEKCLVACEAFRHKGSLSKCTKTALCLIHSLPFNELKTQAACAFHSAKAHTDLHMAYLGYKSCIPMGSMNSQPSTATFDDHHIQFFVLLPSHQNWPEF